MIETPQVTALAPWFGGKRTLASTIVGLIGKHSAYFEPFCGGLAVLFAKPESAQETINDLNTDIVNLASLLQDENSAVELYDRLSRTLVCESIMTDSKNYLKENPPFGDEFQQEPTQTRIDRAYWWFLGQWMGRNGVSGTAREDYQIAVRWTPGGGSPTTRWFNAVDALPWWHQRLRKAAILNSDGFEIIPKFSDSSDVVIYCDPPYVAQTRSGMMSGRKGSSYRHEFDASDHLKLALLLREFKRARIIVSYYDCEQVRELYDGWTFHEIKMEKLIARTSGKRDTVNEVLICNFNDRVLFN